MHLKFLSLFMVFISVFFNFTLVSTTRFIFSRNRNSHFKLILGIQFEAIKSGFWSDISWKHLWPACSSSRSWDTLCQRKSEKKAQRKFVLLSICNQFICRKVHKSPYSVIYFSCSNTCVELVKDLWLQSVLVVKLFFRFSKWFLVQAMKSFWQIAVFANQLESF